MCTTKQQKYLAVLAGKLGKAKEWDKWGELDKDEASELVVKWEDELAVKEAKEASREEPKQVHFDHSDINQARLGLAMKEALRDMGQAGALSDQSKWRNRVWDIYCLFENAAEYALKQLKEGSK